MRHTQQIEELKRRQTSITFPQANDEFANYLRDVRNIIAENLDQHVGLELEYCEYDCELGMHLTKNPYCAEVGTVPRLSVWSHLDAKMQIDDLIAEAQRLLVLLDSKCKVIADALIAAR